jgi:hypothetical protein
MLVTNLYNRAPELRTEEGLKLALICPNSRCRLAASSVKPTDSNRLLAGRHQKQSAVQRQQVGTLDRFCSLLLHGEGLLC